MFGAAKAVASHRTPRCADSLLPELAGAFQAGLRCIVWICTAWNLHARDTGSMMPNALSPFAFKSLIIRLLKAFSSQPRAACTTAQKTAHGGGALSQISR